MKAQDLRVGNLFDNEGLTVHIMDIKTSGENKPLASFGYFVDSIGFERYLHADNCPKPIPLSPDWLIRLGFKSNSTAEKYLDKIVFDHEHKSFRLIRYLGGTHSFHLELAGGARRYVREVHDLQNLFYIIEGEELTLKP